MISCQLRGVTDMKDLTTWCVAQTDESCISLKNTIKRAQYKCFPKGKRLKYLVRDLPKGSEHTLGRQPAW